MSTISVIINVLLAVMTLFVVVFFTMLFKKQRTTNIIFVPSYNESVKKILDDKSGNEGIRISQEKLLENADFVLNAFDEKE